MVTMLNNVVLLLLLPLFLSPTALGQDLKETKLKVVTIAEAPFVFNQQGREPQGFLIDLLDLIKEKVDFQYELYFVEDGNYGAKQPDGKWNGMVGDLLAGDADMILAPLSINSDRLKVMDFTYPFMEVGVTMTARRPLPGAKLPFTNLYELISSNFRYGAIKDGSTINFFKKSKYRLHEEMADLIVNQWGEDNLPETTAEAILKVKNEPYVHLGESAYMEYWVGKECSIMTIGSQISRTSYGLGFKKGSEVARNINPVLLELRENGTVDKLYAKWWSADNCRKPKLCICGQRENEENTVQDN